MTYPEFPPEGHHLPNREKTSREIRQLNLWLPLELSTRVYELILDKRIKSKSAAEDERQLLLAFIRLRMAIDQAQLGLQTPEQNPSILVGDTSILVEGHLAKYRPSPKNDKTLQVGRTERKLITNLARAHGVKNPEYAAEAIALGLEIMKAAEKQMTYPQAVTLSIGDQDFFFAYQRKSRVLTPVNPKPQG